MRNIILAFFTPVLLISLYANYLFYRGEIGSASYTYVKLMQTDTELTAYAPQEVSHGR